MCPQKDKMKSCEESDIQADDEGEEANVPEDPSPLSSEFFSYPPNYEGPLQTFIPIDYEKACSWAAAECADAGWKQTEKFNPETMMWGDDTFTNFVNSYNQDFGPVEGFMPASSDDDPGMNYYFNAGLTDEQIEDGMEASNRKNEEKVLSYFEDNGQPEEVPKLVSPKRWSTFNRIYHFLVSIKKIHHVADPFFVMDAP